MERKRRWENSQGRPTKNYTCGYSFCGRQVGSDQGWYHADDSGSRHDGWIYICPNCQCPTFFDGEHQVPGVSLGSDVKHLPDEIKAIWTEIRTCTSHDAFTAAVLSGRKLLMHIAVGQGADAGLSFVQYVDYLVSNHYAPPNSRSWIDKIRTHGNEANHEIIVKSSGDAEEILTFLEMLLKFIYEFPGRVPEA
jgi:hypothetical protein